MKKLILRFILIPSLAFAAPFFVCDPDPACETYNVYADGALLASTPAPLAYDLIASPPKGISYTAECCNVEGCSARSNPYVSIGVPGTPMNGRITIQP